MLRKKREILAVREFCEETRKKLGRKIKAIKLYGSKATGKDVAGSDIDLFVIVSRKNREIEETIMDIAFHLDLKYDVYISPRVISESVLRHPLWRITHFIREIEARGIPL